MRMPQRAHERGIAAEVGIGSWWSKCCPAMMETTSIIASNLGPQRPKVEGKGFGFRLPVYES